MWLDAGQGLGERLANRADLRPMRGIVDIHPSGSPGGPLTTPHHLPHGPEDRLHHTPPMEPRGARRATDHIDQGPLHVLAERLLAAVQLLRESLRAIE